MSVPSGWIELHRHLDISIRLETLYELAQARGIVAQSTSISAFRATLYPSAPYPDLPSALAQFDLFRRVQDRPETLIRIARETIEVCAAQGLSAVELRFSPGWLTERSGMSYSDVTDAYLEGIRQGLALTPGFQAGLICIASRDQGPDTAAKTVEFFLRRRMDFIGLDLAGPEVGFPSREFAEAFKPAHGQPITVHAGEADGPDSVWSALEELGARRIGHGIRSIEDPQLVAHLARHQTCLEICPSSNWLIGVVPSYAAHPIRALQAAGVPTTLNTDDPGFFGIEFREELRRAQAWIGMTKEDLEKARIAAWRATFLSPGLAPGFSII